AVGRLPVGRAILLPVVMLCRVQSFPLSNWKLPLLPYAMPLKSECPKPLFPYHVIYTSKIKAIHIRFLNVAVRGSVWRTVAKYGITFPILVYFFSGEFVVI